jgi:isopenicillin N synthase-like dioxygenase
MSNDTITSDSVASVSLKDADKDPKAFADELGNSFVEYGFAIVRDHGVPQDLIDRAEELSKQFFALPEDVKRSYLIEGSGGARGYTAFGIETAKGATASDLKEFFHVGRDLPEGHKFRAHMGDNVWPAEVADFKDVFQQLYAEFDKAGVKILRAVARFLKIDEDYFTDTVRDGNSVMRLLHYPPQPEPTGEHIRAGAHEDINTITLLLGAEEAGLQLKTKDGRWLDVSPKPGELVINIGDMLQRLTNGVLRSTSHRVINPAPDRVSNARYSMPFFLHFRSDFLIEALPSTVPEGEEPKWPPITADAYLQERLREIKLK